MGTRARDDTRTLLAVNPAGVAAGAEKVLLRVLDAARDAGWQVVVAAPDGPLVVELAAAGFPCVRIPDLKLPAGLRIVALARAAIRSVRAGRRIRRAARHADVVVANGVLALPALWMASLSRPAVWIVHDVVARRDWRVLARLCAGAVTTAVAPSEAAARPLRAEGIPTRVIRNGTEWPVLPASQPAQPPVVGIAAFLAPQKGHMALLDALARLPRRDVVLDVMGGTFPKGEAYVGQLRARAAEADLDGRVRFLGHVADPLERMRGWSVAVLPSVYPESAGLAVLEAMSLGVPVVATDHGGPPEVVGDAGLVVEPGDVDGLATAIERLLDDEQLRARCAQAGPRLVAAGLTLERQQQELLALLDDVAAHDRRALTWVVPDFVPGLGGTSRQTIILGKTLSRRGHTVHVLTRRRTSELARREVIDGLAVTRVGLPGNGVVAEKLGLLSVALRLMRRRRGVVQVLMYPDFVLSAALAGRLPFTTMGWVGLGDATDALGPAPGLLRRAQRGVRRAALRRCANTVLIPSMERELTQLGLEAELIPLPVDLERFRPPTSLEREAARAALSVSPDELVVVYTGQLRRLKAVDRLIDAFAGFVEDDRSRRLIVVGGASGTADACEDELRDQVAATGLDDRVTITGTVLDVRAYLWAADVFVLPSTREGMSYSLVEAMACGLACVAPVYPIGRDVLGDAGLVPPDNEPASLRACLVALANDPDERVRLGKAAAEAAQAWEVERVVDRYESVFERLPGARRS